MSQPAGGQPQNSPEELIDRLVRALAPIEGITLAYLFGSRAGGRPRPESDLDVAVAYRRQLDALGRERVRRDVIAALTDELGPLGERADVLDLERAGSAVAFDAIRGVRLKVADERTRVLAEASIARRYDDEAPRRALFRASAARLARPEEG